MAFFRRFGASAAFTEASAEPIRPKTAEASAEALVSVVHYCIAIHINHMVIRFFLSGGYCEMPNYRQMGTSTNEETTELMGVYLVLWQCFTQQYSSKQDFPKMKSLNQVRGTTPNHLRKTWLLKKAIACSFIVFTYCTISTFFGPQRANNTITLYYYQAFHKDITSKTNFI